MADPFADNDCDSAFGDDESLLAHCLSLPPYPVAGTKRDADNVMSLHSAQALPDSGPSGQAVDKEHRAEHIDPQMLCYRYEAGCDLPPSKRRASAQRVSQLRTLPVDHPASTLNSDHLFPDTCFEQFCQGCDLEPPCNPSCPPETACSSPCALPCPGGEHCSEDDVCWDPSCDQRQCIDHCVDPECKNTSTVGDPCLPPSHSAPPCSTGPPETDCHLAHSAPTAGGTIYCYDNATCHFQEGPHVCDTGLLDYETYPCFSLSHHADPRNVTASNSTATSPVLSTTNYTSIESAFSHPSTPAPGQGASTECFLNIPYEHCHLNNLCCHGPTRECSDVSITPQQHIDIWNSPTGQSNGLANSFSNFGLHPQPNTLTQDFQNPMFGLEESSWMFSERQFPNNSLDFLASAAQVDFLNPSTSVTNTPPLDASPTAIGKISTTDTLGDSQTCVCKWQHDPTHLCLAVFNTAEALHKHIKTVHVDNCTRCFCQWEGCEASSKDFKQRSKLSRHLLGHAGYRPYACSFQGCDKTFATNQAKDNHERTHTGARPYVCDKCGYTTTTHTQLQTHISALHEGKKPHKCRFCDFTCADSSNLSKHERTHQTLRPYRCPHPGCTFKPDCRWENLKRHLRRSNHCPQLLVEGSAEYRTYRENVRREIDEWHKRNDDGSTPKVSRRKGRG